MEFCMEDCRAALNGATLTVENSRIRRRFTLRPEGLLPTEVRDLRSGAVFSQEKGSAPVIPSGFAPDESPSLRLSGSPDGKGFSVSVSYEEGDCSAEFRFFLAPKLPFVRLERTFHGDWSFPKEESSAASSPDGIELAENAAASEDVIDAVPLPGKHWDLETTILFDQTDRHDTLARSIREPLYTSARERGNLFLFANRLTNRGLLLIKESPTVLNRLNQYPADLSVSDGTARLLGSGLPEGGSGKDFKSYGSTVGVGDCDRIFSEYKRFYQAQWTSIPETAFSMSNTWGDRHQDLAVCDSFIRKEIDAAASIGIDFVQIDDGWQKGRTANSARKKGVWEGYYASDPDFWKPDPDKFPEGLKPLSAYAASKEVKLALWFSPDSSRDFKNWKRDASTLLELWRKCRITAFKLDGVKLRTKAAERNYLSLLSRVTEESKGVIAFQQDITAEDRTGYLWQKQYGTLFVENRYTAWGNYYPHNTLRNLWTLSRFFPARKFQFELLNNRLNREQYPNDPLAPEKVDIRYELAAVFFANPLFWMELQHLTPEDQKALGSLLSVWKSCRKELADAEIIPIGRIPSGASVTGFQADCGNGSGYLLLFREPLAPENGVLKIRPVAAPLKPLATNLPKDGFTVSCDGEWLTATLSHPGSYLLLRYRK